MKKNIILSASVFTLIFTSCGPAAEDRQMMHERAKVFQDSIANIIRMSMAEAEAPLNNVTPLPAPAPATATTASTSPNPNAK